jgi:hypothetical protein
MYPQYNNNIIKNLNNKNVQINKIKEKKKTKPELPVIPQTC